MPRKTTTAPSLSPVIVALQNLHASGDRSFEELTAGWLSRLSGARVRRCKAGDQGGVDAVAEIPFAIEDKRRATDIATREILGGLAAAVVRYPDLQLWVLVATCAVAEQAYREVKDAAQSVGIAVLIIDATRGQPELPNVTGIAALAATDIDTTMRVLADPDWRARGRKPNLAALRRELTAIRKLPAFSTWDARLRNELCDLPTWRRLVRSQNHRLYSLILQDAANAFDTPYVREEAVPRTAEAELTAWWESCRPPDGCEIAVVTGDRYGGKTWLIFRWLLENLRSLPLPVFFFSSRKVQDERGRLERLIVRETEEALGSSFRRHAQGIIDRHRSRGTGTEPWCLVILDGANEYVQVPQSLGEAVMWAHPSELQPLQRDDDYIGEQPTETARRCALVITCRTVNLTSAEQRFGGRPTRSIELGPYDDQELAAALDKASVTTREFASLPEDAQQMARHPRYLALTLRHWQSLGRFGGATSNTLLYLDAVDKVLPREVTVRFEPEPFKEFLAKLAERWHREQALDYATLRQEVAALTQQVDGHVKELISSGVVTEVEGKLVPDLDRLALGMGLFIRDRLRSLHDRAEWAQALRDILEPHGDDDEKVRWLRAAVTTSAFGGDDSRNPDLPDYLLSEWLSARNFSEQDLDELRNLTPFVFKSVLRMISSAEPIETSLLLIAEAMIHTEIAYDERPVANAVQRWLRLVPTDPPWYLQEGEQPPDFRRSVADPSLHGLDLELASSGAGKSIRKRQRLGFALAWSYPSLIRPVDLLAFVAGRYVATDSHLGDGEELVIRRLRDKADQSWFEQEVALWGAKREATRTLALRDLISYRSRRDLRHLLARLPKLRVSMWPPKPERATLFRGTTNILHDASRARLFALNPSTHPPPRAWRAALRKAALSRFRGPIRLHRSRSVTKDALDLEGAEPALAAWAPETGAQIWRSVLADIPRQIADGEEGWAWDLGSHTALLTPADCRLLVAAVLNVPKNREREPALQRAYLCALAEASPLERLQLLLEHPFDFEYTNLYDVLAAGGDDALRRKTAIVVGKERDSRRLKRARYLLAHLGGMEASRADLARLVAELSNIASSQHDKDAARELLRYSRIPTSTPDHALRPLIHVAASLAEEAWQYEAFLDLTRRPGKRGAEWIARARSAPVTARHRGAGRDISDEAAVAHGIERLAAEIAQHLAQPVGSSSQQFPEGIAAAISEAAFDEWVESILVSPTHALHHHSGLLVPVVYRALRTRHTAAGELWTLVYPFQRARFSSGIRFTDHGLDWTLRDIHDPAVDDELARELLRNLVSDCRTNGELVEVALGVRLESASRLTDVIQAAFDSDDELERARARFIAGWMPENRALRRRLAQPDSSEWVDKIGKNAIARLDRERWARIWLRRFLSEPRRVYRWAAGRLFLKCTDAATIFWANDVVRKAQLVPARRAEAHLLVAKIREKTSGSELRDRFLGHSVRELEAVVPPWRRAVGWGDIEIKTPPDATAE